MKYEVEVTENYTIWRDPKTKKYHRLDGPAIEYSDGTKHWYVEGKWHRIDGPAIEFSNGEKRWYAEGKLHRLDGPAIERSNGTKLWYVEGKQYSETDFNNLSPKVKPKPCSGKVVIIDGIEYALS